MPPYSPDFNPIERCWSKIKTFLRAAKARTGDRLDEAIEQAFETVTEADARAWFNTVAIPYVNLKTALKHLIGASDAFGGDDEGYSQERKGMAQIEGRIIGMDAVSSQSLFLA